MPDTCPFLDYRAAADGKTFDAERAYCTAAEQFVQAMRADICNDRYDLDHSEDCEIYRAHAGELDGADGDADEDADGDRDESGEDANP